MTHYRRLIAVSITAVVATGLAACTGIPASSKPQSIQSLGVVEPGGQVPSPPPNADPRTIVGSFLQANALNDPRHNSARAFLTTQAKTHWTDTTITVIADPQVSNIDTQNKITVTGQQVGTIDQNGIYTPTLQGDGEDGGATASSFTMKKVSGQWRIDVLPSGLLINNDQFDGQYRQRVVYFFDQAEDHLVPDPRYTDLTDPTELTDWLLERLAPGPRDTLLNAEVTELPAQTTPRLTVLGNTDAHTGVTKIEIPGASQLSGSNRNRLAAQIGLTLQQVDGIDDIQITDGGIPVSIPAAASTVFTANEVSPPFVPSPRTVGLYYIHNHGVVDENGAPIPGNAGKDVYGLTSVALADRGGVDGMLIAATRGSPDDASLDIGTEDTPLMTTRIPAGRLSRPDWAPDVNEVWIGDNSTLYRVLPNGSFSVVPVAVVAGSPTGRIVAVRLSPEGSRVALILSTPPSTGNPQGTSQIYVGAVVRGTASGQAQVRVENLTPISPQGVTVTDLAWNDELKLFAIGHTTSPRVPGVYDVQVDGSLWTPRGIGSLPPEPDSITVTEGQVAVVSSDGTVWKQLAGSWISPQGEETSGTNPIYSE